MDERLATLLHKAACAYDRRPTDPDVDLFSLRSADNKIATWRTAKEGDVREDMIYRTTYTAFRMPSTVASALFKDAIDGNPTLNQNALFEEFRCPIVDILTHIPDDDGDHDRYADERAMRFRRLIRDNALARRVFGLAVQKNTRAAVVGDWWDGEPEVFFNRDQFLTDVDRAITEGYDQE